MTIASTSVQTSGASCNGSTTSFSFSFRVADYGSTDAEDAIQVILETVSTGAETVLTKTTHYTVSVNSDQDSSPGGSITTVSTYSSAYKIWIRLNPAFLQETDLQAQGAYSAAVTEGQYDELQRQINWLRARVLKAPHAGVQASSSFSGEITGDLTAGYVPVVNGALDGFTWGTPAAGATIAAAMVDVVTSVSHLAALNELGDVFPFYIPTAETDTAINTAIAAANAAGGGVVLLKAADYTITTGIAALSNVAVIGVPGRTKFVGASSSSSINFVSYTGTLGSNLSLASSAAADAKTLTLSNGSSLAAGDIIEIQATEPTSSQVHAWMTMVVDKAGGANVPTIANPMPIAVGSGDTHQINEVTAYLSRFVLKNVIFRCGSNTGSTTHGIYIIRAVNCEFENLEFEDLVNGSGIQLYDGLYNTVRDIYTTNCGNTSYAAAYFQRQSDLQASNIQGYEDAGFGVQFERGAWINAVNINCTRSGNTVGGRGVKVAGVLRSNFANIESSNNAYTGLAISNETRECIFTNVVLVANGWSAANSGLWFSGQYNANNIVHGFIGSSNLNYDIQFASTDSNNHVLGARYSTLTDAGTGNVVQGLSSGKMTVNAAWLSSGSGGVGYATGAGGAVTQGTSRTTTVQVDAICGAITLVSAAGSTTPATFTVTNNKVAATDVVVLSQKSGTDKYVLLVTAVGAGSFAITAYTTGGTTTEQPVINFAVIKAVAA